MGCSGRPAHRKKSRAPRKNQRRGREEGASRTCAGMGMQALEKSRGAECRGGGRRNLCAETLSYCRVVEGGQRHWGAVRGGPGHWGVARTLRPDPGRRGEAEGGIPCSHCS